MTEALRGVLSEIEKRMHNLMRPVLGSTRWLGKFCWLDCSDE